MLIIYNYSNDSWGRQIVYTLGQLITKYDFSRKLPICHNTEATCLGSFYLDTDG